MDNDVVGLALLDYYSNNYSSDIIVKSSISEDDIISISYLFRGEKELPKLEEKALSLCRGKVLDVGAGSGCHSLILQEKGINVSAIDSSKGAVEVMQKRGLDAQHIDFENVIGKYDTLIILMNGVGLAGTLSNLISFLKKAKSILAEGGQILVDSSDISYMFKDEDGSILVDLNSSFYGEVTYQMEYKGMTSDKFDWLFVDFETLKLTATEVGFNVKLIFEDEHHQYLVQLSI